MSLSIPSTAISLQPLSGAMCKFRFQFHVLSGVSVPRASNTAFAQSKSQSVQNEIQAGLLPCPSQQARVATRASGKVFMSSAHAEIERILGFRFTHISCRADRRIWRPKSLFCSYSIPPCLGNLGCPTLSRGCGCHRDFRVPQQLHWRSASVTGRVTSGRVLPLDPCGQKVVLP